MSTMKSKLYVTVPPALHLGEQKVIPAAVLLASSVNHGATDALRSWLSRPGRHQDVTLEINGEQVSFPENLSEGQLKELIELIEISAEPQEAGTGQGSGSAQGSGTESTPEPQLADPTVGGRKQPEADALSRRLILGDGNTVSELPPSLGGVALGSSSEFYAGARRRIALAFRLSVGLALALAIILFGGIAATIVSGLAGHAAWSATFGGVSVASLLGVYAYKPLAAISEATVASQRLEIIHAQLANQLKACTEQLDLDKRIRCQTAVWNAIQKEMAAMSSKAY